MANKDHTRNDAYPDAELLRLGVLLESAWAEERAIVAALRGDDSKKADGLVDDAIAVCGEIVDQIENLTATTLAGLRVKARAVCWCCSEDEIDDTALNDQGTTDVRLAAGILRDILAAGGAA